MVETIVVYDELSFFNILKFIFKKNHKIYYLKKNFFTEVIIFFKFKSPNYLDWNLYFLKKNSKKVITYIIEDQKVDKFVYDFLNNFFIKKNNKSIDQNFYHYLVKTFSNQKNLISFMSIENFIILYEVTSAMFYKKKIKFFFCKNIFEDFITQKYTSNDITFKFYRNIFNYNLIKSFLVLFKILFKLRNKITIKDRNKSICVLDSYEINAPDNFLSNISESQIVFMSLSNFKKNKKILNIYNTINLKFIFIFFIIFFRYFNFYKNNYHINYFLIDFFLKKEIFLIFFKNKNIKLFITSHIYQNYVSSAVAAIHDLNGIALGFAISFTHQNNSHQNIDAFDYFISFNNSKSSDGDISNLKKILKLGYVQDYKFKLVKKDSRILKENLKKNGVKYIIGFFDQGSSYDSRFSIGHEPSRYGYEFLLKKIILNPEFGLIIKPKKPKLLKEKLGKVYDILIEAKATQRCIVFEDFHYNNEKNFEDIPAKIALASDITIHDTLLAGTAGFESALCSKKSVYFDYYDSKNKLFLDKKLKIVYKDWNLLWQQIVKDSKGIADLNFGNWSKIIDKFDTYRDGNTNKRICFYLKNILSNLK
jgi:hypothetical protein